MVHDKYVLFLWAEQNELRILACFYRVPRRPKETRNVELHFTKKGGPNGRPLLKSST